MKKNIVLALLNIISLIVTLVVNATANIKRINGYTTGEISDKFDVLFKPSGYVFSIWTIIYIGLIAFVVFQILPTQLKSDFHKKIGIYFIVSNIANALWIYNWHYKNFLLTVLLIIVMLYCLLRIYINLQIGLTDVSILEKISAHFPFSFYTAWICIATLANITVYLKYVQWNGFGAPDLFWFTVLLIVGLVLLFYIIHTRTDMAFGFVFWWAYVGIADKNANVTAASRIAWMCVAVLVGILIFGIVKKIKAAQS